MGTIQSLRILGRYWKLTAISAFSLAVAMALGVLALSVSNTLLVLPPAAPSPDRLVAIHSRSPNETIDDVSYPDFEYYRDHNHVFTSVAAAPNSIGLLDDFNFEGRDVKVIVRPVSENYFTVLGIQPYLGRLFGAGDDAAGGKLAVMTWACWKRLGSDPNIVGKVLAKHTIVGVTPKDFTGSFFGLNGDLLTPLNELEDDRVWFSQRGARRLLLIARMKPGVTRTEAQAEMTALSGQLASAYPQVDKDRAAVVTRATLLPPDVIPGARVLSAILIAMVLLVLLIACANVANLLLAVAVGRRQEAAIKLALGAPRGRLVREFLRESAILCAASGAAGFAIAAVVVARFSDLAISFPLFGTYSFGLNLRLDATVVAFTLALTVIASLATGLAPALYASSPALAQILGGELVVGGTRKGVRRNALVVLQVAVCTLVLVGMGLCQRNLYNLRHVDPGFSARNLVAVTVYATGEGYSEAQGKQLYGTLRRTVAALPGVESVTLSSHLPLFGASPESVQIPGNPKATSVSHAVIDSDYFSTFGIPILSGRPIDSRDSEKSLAVAVINQKMAEMFWPGTDPVGRTFTGGDPGRNYTVVGVAANGKYIDPDEPTRPFLYYALSQHYLPGIGIIARTRADPVGWVEPMAQALRGLGLKIMIQPVTLQTWLNLTLITQRFIAGAVAALSALGLLLATLGLFGAISYAVSQRKKELGIRIALGAQPSQLMQLILRQTLFVAGVGVSLGVLLGMGEAALLRSQFFGISAVEWRVLIPVGGAMLALSLLVAYLSARPWIRIDPMDAVRHA